MKRSLCPIGHASRVNFSPARRRRNAIGFIQAGSEAEWAGSHRRKVGESWVASKGLDVEFRMGGLLWLTVNPLMLEEPGAGKPPAGICAGASGNRCPYRDRIEHFPFAISGYFAGAGWHCISDTRAGWPRRISRGGGGLGHFFSRKKQGPAEMGLVAK